MILINTAMRDGIISYLTSFSAGLMNIQLYGGTQTTPNSAAGMTLLAVASNIPTSTFALTGSYLKTLRLAGSLYTPVVQAEGLATWAICVMGSVSIEVSVTTGDEGVVMTNRSIVTGNPGLIKSLSIRFGTKS